MAGNWKENHNLAIKINPTWRDYLMWSPNYRGQQTERWTSFFYHFPGHLQEELHLLGVSGVHPRPESLPICSQQGWPWRMLFPEPVLGWLKLVCEMQALQSEVSELLCVHCLQLLLHPAIKPSLDIAMVHAKPKQRCNWADLLVKYVSLQIEPKWEDVQDKSDLASFITVYWLASCAVKSGKCDSNWVPLLEKKIRKVRLMGSCAAPPVWPWVTQLTAQCFSASHL